MVHVTHCDLNRSAWAMFTSCTRGSGSAMYSYAEALEQQGATVGQIFCGYYPDPSFNATVRLFELRWPGRVAIVREHAFDFNAHLRRVPEVTHMWIHVKCARREIEQSPSRLATTCSLRVRAPAVAQWKGVCRCRSDLGALAAQVPRPILSLAGLQSKLSRASRD